MTPHPDPLSQETKRIRLAEAAGWRFVRATYRGRSVCPKEGLSLLWFIDKVESSRDWLVEETSERRDLEPHEIDCLPDFFVDLNATHALEKLLTPAQAQSYFQTIRKIISEPPEGSEVTISCFYIHANAATRGEALGSALGLWQTGQ